MKRILAILLFVTILSACKKTTLSPTQGALTAQKLISVLVSASGTLTNERVTYVNNNTGYHIYTATAYNISADGYITLSNTNQNTYTYNLTFLKDYTVYSTSPENIQLDFSF